ncbi:uncharacterized protein LOC129951337 [Eupeodes corollae]|uniref:uncharacterized protein LOC129951337 n=1 Tax=Eupeodes corollae TaxID=290404 RepID=UPI002492FDFA|nr:uncharacterized protein LOC129951337 [Eupeodes corollae]
MGNICSTSQKNCKDADSEMSEGGGSDGEYKSPTKDQDEDKILHEKTDPVNTPDSNNTVNPKNDTNEFTHHPNCDENEKINKTNVSCGANTNSIFGKPPKHNAKIVLYIIMSNRNEYEKQFCIINRFLPDLLTHARAKGFELTVSFTHHEILSKHKNDHSSKNEINENPFRHHEELENHLNEINRHKNSYIVPVIFFGNSLEYLHCPTKIEQKDFSFLLSITSKDQSDLLQQFYKADTPGQSSTSYSLNSHSSLKKEETEQILETFITLMPINLKTTYLASTVEKIINDVVLKSKDMIKHCVWIQDENSSESCAPDSALIKSEVSTRHSNLNCQLRDEIPVKNIIPPLLSSDEDEEIYDLLKDVLKSNIDSVMHEHLVKYNSRNTHGLCKPIVDEIEAVRRHSIAIGANLDSPYDLEGILKYIRSDSLYPLAVFSPPEEEEVFGSQLAFSLEKLMEDSHLILRYARLTVVSSEVTSLLASIADQVSIIVAGKPCHTQHSILNYKQKIEQLLESSDLSIIIIIESSDKVFGATDFDWLPKISKPNAKIILSISSNGNPTNNVYAKELINRGVPKENLLPLLRDTSTNKEKNLKTHLESNRFEAKLNSKLLCFGVKIDSNDIEKMTETLLCTLESKIDVEFLEILLVIIAISPYGLYETDCINIFEEQAKIEKVCSLTNWSRFCWLMGPMLTHTDNIKLINNVLKSAVLKRYSKNILQIKTTIKRYYENQPDSFLDTEKNTTSLNGEKYSKVPQYDLSILSGSEENIIEQYFTKYYFKDLSWISNKITSSGCFQYLYDIIIAEEKFKKTLADSFQHIALLKLFLAQNMMQLNYDGSQFYTFFKVFLKNTIAKDESLNSNDYIQHWITTIDQIKITYLESLTNDKDNDNDNQENIPDGTRSYNEVVILKRPGHFIAAISTNCDEICVWDVHNLKKIRVLKSVPQPSLLCSIRDLEVAVLCKREIKVIDLEEGEHKATLKGVMNQKMPYFGLHDEEHLVCLSRNRMYVNLMNLKTGDCATSFKAGEDRFLNSLIVSGNGRILVCGDESQKPFSLLVWHLSQRRLLYDLRIPHHDLFTALSAITYEGLYVSVVAKEIKEPGPNFIVVYDLQSGTLFQKLKPACNTVAIAISQANGCVIAGLDNADILIWDLVTGNCRYTLTGHSAPATLMKLDPLGRCLLSGDKDGRDLSVRLWELSTGKSLAVYSPPNKISSCEILDNGLYTIIAMEDASDILILQLKNYDKSKTQSENCTQKSVDCKIHILKEN